MYHGIGYGIHTGQVGTFEGVASVTGKGEIMIAVIDKMLLCICFIHELMIGMSTLNLSRDLWWG